MSISMPHEHLIKEKIKMTTLRKLENGGSVYVGIFQKQGKEPIPKQCFKYQQLLGWTDERVLVLSCGCLRIYLRKDWEKQIFVCRLCLEIKELQEESTLLCFSCYKYIANLALRQHLGKVFFRSIHTSTEEEPKPKKEFTRHKILGWNTKEVFVLESPGILKVMARKDWEHCSLCDDTQQIECSSCKE